VTSFIPVSARTALLQGQIDVTDGTLSAVLVADTYTVSAAHASLDDIAGGAQVAIAVVDSIAVSDGEVYGSVTFPSVASGPTCTQLWFFMDTGTPATSLLVSYVDQFADRRPITSGPIVPNGGDITLTWPADRLFGIGTPVTV
jgi:hypothetical protein